MARRNGRERGWQHRELGSDPEAQRSSFYGSRSRRTGSSGFAAESV